jgi:hypothetical protein
MTGARSPIPLLHRRALACFLMCAVFAKSANAADPQPYNVMIEPSVSSQIEGRLRDSSLLATLREMRRSRRSA